MPLKTDNLLSLCKTSVTGETTFRIKNVILFHWSLGKKNHSHFYGRDFEALVVVFHEMPALVTWM